MFVRINGDTGTNYFSNNLQCQGTTVTGGVSSSGTSAFVGLASGGGSNIGVGTLKVHNLDASRRPTWEFTNWAFFGGNSTTNSGGGLWASNALVTSITLFLGAGTFTAANFGFWGRV
jgi:hypothetical protein